MSRKSPTRITPLLLAAWLAVGCAATPAVPSDTDRKTRATEARALFVERCKKSGEFIHRTAADVEGLYLLKIRTTSNHGDQFRMDDPYGSDSTGDRYIRSFLIGRHESGSLTSKPEEVATPGYRYVEAIDPADGKRYRYTGRIDQPWLRDKRYGEWVRDFVLDKVPAPDAPPRYGVTFDDISTREEREHWIAGSSLKVIDLQTNEVVAERIGYMMDPGQGEKGGGRSPWLWAADVACPSFFPKGKRPHSPGGSYQAGQTRNFVEKVLKPKGGT